MTPFNDEKPTFIDRKLIYKTPGQGTNVKPNMMNKKT